MSKEAMKLALEALEDLIPLCDPSFSICYDVNKAITALREALANEALDKMAENARELGLDYEPAQQEPVAFLVDGDLYYPEEIDWETLQEQGHTVASLYTTPPQRTWVGLTTKEIREWWASENGLEDCGMAKVDDFEQVVRAIEAKLRSKNNA